MFKIFFLPAISIFMASCASTQHQAKMNLKKNNEMTVDGCTSKIQLKDSELDTTATISTEGCFQSKWGLLKEVWDDIFIRAFVDKKSKATIYQVYFQHKYLSSNWHNLYSANYGSPPTEIRVKRIFSDVRCPNAHINGQCEYREDVTFNLSEKEFQKLFVASQQNVFTLKYNARHSNDRMFTINNKEAASLFKAVSVYKNSGSLGLKREIKRSHTSSEH